MNNKIVLTAVGGAALLAASVANAGYQGLSYEIIAQEVDGAIAGTWTAQIFVDLQAGDRLDAVYGNASNPLSMGTSTTLYQNAFGSDTSAGINEALIGTFKSLAYDSWVTIGRETSTDNALANIGVVFGADSVSSTDGSWYITPEDSQGAEVGGRVLIAQFTTYGDDAVLSGTVSLQGKDANGDNWTAESQSYSFGNVVPAPGALALLGLAGFAGRRRRRA
jgi:hypothetical protein